MTASRITGADLAALVERMDEAADAYIRGDHHHYFSLFEHPDDYTLMPPYGGETLARVHADRGGHRRDRPVLRVRARPRLDVERVVRRRATWPCWCAVERQHGEVGGTPDQDWSLRVTLVFRRAGDGWQLVHRHADPLVREIPFEHFARLARGEE